MFLPLLLQLAGPAWAESPWSAPAAPEGWTATEAHFVLHIREGEPVVVDADYRFATPDFRGGSLKLVGPELLVTYASGPVVATPSGLEMALPLDRMTARQQLSGLYVPNREGAGSLRVLSATRTHIRIDAPGLDVTIPGAVDGWVESRSILSFSWQPQAEGAEPAQRVLMQGEAATAFRADASALAIDSVLRWRVLRGSASSFSFDSGGLTELEVDGPNVASFDQSGSSVVITTKQPVLSLLQVRVRGRVAAGKAERAVPGPQPTGVQRVDRYWLMTKSDEGELVPVSSPPSVGASQLPAWAKGIGEGTPLAQWHGNGELRVFPVDAANIQGPDTVITSARYIVAAAREGRAGLRMTLRVRNERRQFLHVTPPPGWRAIVIRVSNQPVSILDDGRGGLYVPLEKSIETVKGLLSFPVDIEWVGDEEAWGKRGHHTFALPAVDAPIQAAEWEVHLPRGFKGFVPEIRGGEFVITDLREKDALPEQNDELLAKRQAAEQVESALSNAVSAYKKNDFETAQMWIDNARNVSDSNEEVEQLQSNLDVLSGKAAPSGSASTEVVQRRVRDLAKAKTGGLVSKQVEVEEKALEAYRSGDLDKAEALYGEVFELANELQRTEQAESTAQTSKIAGSSGMLESIRKEKGKKADESRAWGNDDAQASASLVPLETVMVDGFIEVRRGNVTVERQTVADYYGDAEPEANEPASRYDRWSGESDQTVVDGLLATEGYGEATGEIQELEFTGDMLVGSLGGVGLDVGAYGISGLGISGTGVGGGGSAEGGIGLGSVGTKGAGQGYGYGSGSLILGGKGFAPGDAAAHSASDDDASYPVEESEEMEGEGYEYAGAMADEEDPAPVVTETTLSKDYLSRVPAGQEYNSVVMALPGTTRGAKDSKKVGAKRESRKGEAEQKPSDDRSDKDSEDFVRVAQSLAQTVTITGSGRGSGNGSASTRAEGKTKAAPPPMFAMQKAAESPSPEPMPAPATAPTSPPAEMARPMPPRSAAPTPTGPKPAPAKVAASYDSAGGDENTWTMDGKNVTDPTTGTFSTNFNYDAIEDVPSTAPSRVADPSPSPAGGGAEYERAKRQAQQVVQPAPARDRDAPPPPPPPASTPDMGVEWTALGYVDDVGGLFGGAQLGQAAASADRQREQSFDGDFRRPAHALPEPKPYGYLAPRKVPLERRRALEATPSPMALAMPLDGPAVAHSHALLPANKAPTFTVRYKELPSENL